MKKIFKEDQLKKKDIDLLISELLNEKRKVYSNNELMNNCIRSASKNYDRFKEIIS